MFSLVITIIAVALVALLALATIYFAGPALSESTTRARASEAISQSAQVLGAAELFLVEQKGWSSSIDDFVEKTYLKEIPRFQDVPWTQPMPNVPTYWAIRSATEDVCKDVNFLARGDNGIYKKARPGLVTQCFGLAAPYTVITTRNVEGEGDFGLDVVFRFFGGEPEFGYDVMGGGWAVEPTKSTYSNGGSGGAGGEEGSGGGSGGSETPGTPVDQGSSAGQFLGGTVTVATAGANGQASNEISVGSLTGGSTTQTLVFSNTGSSPVAVGVPSVTGGDFQINGSTCSALLAPGQSCTVQVQAGPFGTVTQARELTGTLSLPMGGSLVQVKLRGYIQRSSGNGAVSIGLRLPSGEALGDALIFPDTPIGRTSYKWLEVQNVGASMTYNNPLRTITAPFSIASTDCGTTQAPRATCLVRLGFTPAAAKVYGAGDHFFTVHANNDTASLGLSGRGYVAQAYTQGVTLSEGEMDWGSRGAGGTYLYALTVRNSGNTATTVLEAPALTGTGFSLNQSTCLGVLEAGQTCSITVAFSPDSLAVYKGTLKMSWQGAENIEVPLSGAGAGPLQAASAFTLPTGFVGLDYQRVSPELTSAWVFNGAALEPQRASIVLHDGAELPVALDPETSRLHGVPQEPGSYNLQLTGTYDGKFSEVVNLVLLVRHATRAPYLTDIALADGLSRGCGISASRQLWCWGVDMGPYLDSPVEAGRFAFPAPVKGLSNVQRFASSNGSLCAVTTAGLYCLGTNVHYRLGLPTLNAKITTPTFVPGTAGAKDVTLTALRGCILNSSNQVRCIGYSYNSSDPSSATWTVNPSFGTATYSNFLSDEAICAKNSAGATVCDSQLNGYASRVTPYLNQTPNNPQAVSYYAGCVHQNGNLMCSSLYNQAFVSVGAFPQGIVDITMMSVQLCLIEAGPERLVKCKSLSANIGAPEAGWGIVNFDVPPAQRTKVTMNGSDVCLIVDGAAHCRYAPGVNSSPGHPFLGHDKDVIF